MFLKKKEIDFSVLIDSLKFKNSFDNAMTLISGHLNDVQTYFHDFLQKFPIPIELQQELLTLPESNLFRLIASPYFCEHLMLIKDNKNLTDDAVQVLHNQIIQAIVSEIKYSKPDFEYSYQPQWTINGDIVLDKKIAEQFPALQTSCGIQLNYQSYIHNTGKSGISGYSFQAALKHKERIETGKSIIQSTSLSAFSMVEAFTTIIQFRHNLDRPNVVNSSTHTSIGLIRCDNFQNLHSDMPEIVDMLVHESIHQYLHLFEEQLFPFVKTEHIDFIRTQTDKFPSPWSGNRIDFRSYTHAILVWYGLVHFWRQYIESSFEHSEITKAQAEQKLSEALFGFASCQSVLDNLKEHKSFLEPDYIQQIEILQNSLAMQKAV